MSDKPHLLRFGYAPGNYWFVCNDCGNKRAEGNKRSTRCEACAETLHYQVTSVEAVADKHRTAPMTIPEQAVQAAAEKIREVTGTYAEVAHAALTAAAPYLTAARVGVDESALHTLWTMGNCRLPFDQFKARILSAFEPYAVRAAVMEEAAPDLYDAAKAALSRLVLYGGDNGKLLGNHEKRLIEMLSKALAKARKAGWSTEYEVYSGDEWQAASTDLDGALDYAAKYALDGLEDIYVQEVRRRTLPTPPSSEVV